MEAQKTPRKRRAPRAWLWENGVRKPLVVPKPTRLSAAALWKLNHPELQDGEKLTKAELRAILK